MASPPAIPVPTCPACDTHLEADAERHACPGCGRAFAVVVDGVTPGDVYRAAPVVALVPVRDPAPPGWGLRVNEDRDVLDIRIGGFGLLNRRWLAALGLLLNAVWSGVILLAAALDAGEAALYAVFAGVFGVLAVATRPMRRENERLIVAGGRLVWRRMRGQDEVLASDAIALERIVGVHDRGDRIAVELDGGGVWHVGSGLGVPDGVRDWVARRLALLLPLTRS